MVSCMPVKGLKMLSTRQPLAERSRTDPSWQVRLWCHQGAGERHREPGMFSRDHICAPIGSLAMGVFRRRSPLKGYPATGRLSTQSIRAAGFSPMYSRGGAAMNSNGQVLTAGCKRDRRQGIGLALLPGLERGSGLWYISTRFESLESTARPVPFLSRCFQQSRFMESYGGFER